MGESLLAGHLELSVPNLFFLLWSGKIEQQCNQKVQEICFLYALASEDKGSDLPWVNMSQSGIKLAGSDSMPGMSLFVFTFYSSDIVGFFMACFQPGSHPHSKEVSCQEASGVLQ